MTCSFYVRLRPFIVYTHAQYTIHVSWLFVHQRMFYVRQSTATRLIADNSDGHQMKWANDYAVSASLHRQTIYTNKQRCGLSVAIIIHLYCGELKMARLCQSIDYTGHSVVIWMQIWFYYGRLKIDYDPVVTWRGAYKWYEESSTSVSELLPIFFVFRLICMLLVWIYWPLNNRANWLLRNYREAKTMGEQQWTLP